MNFHLHHYYHSDPELLRRLDRIDKALQTIIERLHTMALDFTKLTDEVTQISSVVDSAIALLTQVADAIRDAAGNQAKVIEIANQLDAKRQQLADAVAANTPSEPTA